MIKAFPKDDCNHWEMVASFGSYLLEYPVMEVLRIAKSFGEQGWKKKYSYDFFKEIEKTAMTISSRKHKKEARDLLQFAQGLAREEYEDEWEERYRKILSQEYANQTKIEWDASRRLRS
ncbi:MAG: hypothetical protein GY755_12540 [Chloroflexi bacterium]|nr:hypothetical protein [Chloroflexota bacterium]